MDEEPNETKIYFWSCANCGWECSVGDVDIDNLQSFDECPECASPDVGIESEYE